MANYDVTIFGDAEEGDITVIGGGTSNDPLQLLVGDTLTVTHSIASNISGSIPVQDWASTHWTVVSTAYVAKSSSVTRTIKTGATLNVTDTINCVQSGYTTGSIYVEVVSSIDSTPNDFSGSLSNQTNANPNVEYFLGSFTISGINTNVTLSTSGTASPESRKGTSGTKSSSSKTVSNGDTIYIWGTSSSSYNASTTASITVGTLTVSKTITTMVDPATGTRIPFPVSSGAISMNDIRSFFGPKSGTAALGSYYRGGTYVPNTTTGTPNNSGVPASGTIQLDDFYNSFTTMYFSTAPTNKSVGLNTTSTAQSATINWNRNDDWEVGFGPDMEDGVDYQLVHEITTYGGFAGSITDFEISFGGTDLDLTVASNRSAYTFSYSTNNANAINVSVTAAAQSEFFITGEITFRIRHKEQTSYTDEVEFYYYITIYGP